MCIIMVEEERKHTPVVCNESREPHTSHYPSRPVPKKTTANMVILDVIPKKVILDVIPHKKVS